MVPVAVGGLHDHVIRPGDRLRIPDDGLVHVADVPGEHQLFRLAVLCGPELHIGRSQQVSRVGEPEGDPLGDLRHLPVFHRMEQGQRGLRVGGGVQGLHRVLAGPGQPAAFIDRVGLLDMGRVQQHDPQELAGHIRGVDGAPEALLDQQGQTAGMVDMGVGDDHIVDFTGMEGETAVVHLVPALLQTAVDQHPAA